MATVTVCLHVSGALYQCPERLILECLNTRGIEMGPLHSLSGVKDTWRIRGFPRFRDFLYSLESTLFDDSSPLSLSSSSQSSPYSMILIERSKSGNHKVFPNLQNNGITITLDQWLIEIVNPFCKSLEKSDLERARKKGINAQSIAERRQRRREHRKRKQQSIVDDICDIICSLDLKNISSIKLDDYHSAQKKTLTTMTTVESMISLRQSLYTDLHQVCQELDQYLHVIGVQPSLDTTTSDHHCESSPSFPSSSVLKWGLQWSEIPESIRAEQVIGSHVRGTRKKHQVDCVFEPLKRMVDYHRHRYDSLYIDAHKQPIHIVDFGCGTGNIGLPLAHAFPDCKVTLIDHNSKCIDLCRHRALKARLTNIELICRPLSDLLSDHHKSTKNGISFDIGVAVHCCGDASDLAMELSICNDASIILIPCCVGKIKLFKKQPKLLTPKSESDLLLLEYPRSKWLSAQMDYDDYLCLSKAADHNAQGRSDRRRDVAARRMCKSLLEWDRVMRVKEMSKKHLSKSSLVWLSQVIPNEGLMASPKSDMLISL